MEMLISYSNLAFFLGIRSVPIINSLKKKSKIKVYNSSGKAFHIIKFLHM